MMFGPWGSREETMAQGKRVKRANAAPDSKKPKVVTRALRATGESSPPARLAWLKPIADYKRHQTKAFAVTRFGRWLSKA
jgi:hypothetical protein